LQRGSNAASPTALLLESAGFSLSAFTGAERSTRFARRGCDRHAYVERFRRPHPGKRISSKQERLKMRNIEAL
jgi:hypothetical protein